MLLQYDINLKLKPIKQIILGMRASQEASGTSDLSDLVASSLGTAIHDGLEKAWTSNYKKAMESLGLPEKVINNIKINPELSSLSTDDIPVYLEQRSTKKLLGWNVSGKFDLVLQGRVNDLKTTGTYTYIKGTNDSDYILQGSIYRWLNQDIITADDMSILYVFTDWSALSAKTNKNYPKSKVLEKKFQLMSLAETEAYIRTKLSQIDRLINAHESEIPDCTDAELWRGDTQYKYYKNPEKTGRATKNFNSMSDAQNFLATNGHVGIIKEVKALAKRCKYCSANSICSQRISLANAGLLAE